MNRVVFFATAFFLSFFSIAQIPNPILAPFLHGVASGDALTDKVIIWTRITASDSTSYTVSWKIATDTLLTLNVQSGSFITDSSVDFTVKVDVTGLQPDTWYYYQFQHNGRKSLIGRTKTLPAGQNGRIRLAVASCGRYGGGDYYNSYSDIARRNDIQGVVFLGDYIYEGSGSVSGRGIQVLPTHEIITLEDYRQRYFTYRLDPDLMRVHQQYPFFNVWDDHETANDSWQGGAEEHNDTTEGDWFVRKANGQQAFFEWLPIRPKAQGSYSIYRTFQIGDLADLIMIDSRLEGRDKQAAALDQTAYTDTNRTILGNAQMHWLKTELNNTQARWHIIGNQVMFAPLRLGSVYFSYDQWDGYQADRNRIITHVMNNNINNVVALTGDIHTSWANDVPQPGIAYNQNTSAFVEFITPSISTGSPVDNNLLTLITLTNPHIKYAELMHYGYLVLDIDSSRVQSDWYHISTLTDSNFTVSQAASWYVNSNERFLREATSAAPAFFNAASFAPLTIDNPHVGIFSPNTARLQFEIFPNPFEEVLVIRLLSNQFDEVKIQITDIAGKEILQQHLDKVRDEFSISTADWNEGVFVINLYNNTSLQGTAKVVKTGKDF